MMVSDGAPRRRFEKLQINDDNNGRQDSYPCRLGQHPLCKICKNNLLTHSTVQYFDLNMSIWMDKFLQHMVHDSYQLIHYILDEVPLNGQTHHPMASMYTVLHHSNHSKMMLVFYENMNYLNLLHTIINHLRQVLVVNICFNS